MYHGAVWVRDLLLAHLASSQQRGASEPVHYSVRRKV